MSFPISIIVPSYNGVAKIPRLLGALEKQDRKDFEIIVVIDGSTDNTKEYLEQSAWDLNLSIINQENKGRAGARNAGAAEAKGKYLVFYDDDVQPNSNSVSLHINALKSAPISVGQQLERLNSNTEFGRYKAVISRRWLEDLGANPVILNKKTLFLTAANMAIKTEVFHALKGFDLVLRDAEDFDLAVRAYLANFNIILTPANQVTHEALPSFRDYIFRQREYRKAHECLNQIRKENALFKKYDVNKTAAKKLIYFFIPGISIAAIDRGYFKFLPPIFRFAIYARIISALSVYYPNRKL